MIQENILLAPYTTFKIGGKAKYFCVVSNLEELKEAVLYAKENKLKYFILGGGSNVLFSDKGFDGLVINFKNSGLEIIEENEKEVTLKVGAGETWDKVVEFAVEKNFWGIENLSHIPGLTGAIVVQNVGAYGQEAKNVVEKVEVFDTNEEKEKTVLNDESGFEYRSSVFNTKEKGRYVILYLYIKLKKIPSPILSYRDLKQMFEGKNPSINEIRQAVINIRNTKFPFPIEAKNGNAGSFFKNVLVSEAEFSQVKQRITALFGEEIGEKLEQKVFRSGNELKIPAAFLLDICGLKDVENGGAAINNNQPLVVINKTGQATAKDVLGLAKIVLKTVYEKTGLVLKLEPEVLGFDENELNDII